MDTGLIEQLHNERLQNGKIIDRMLECALFILLFSPGLDRFPYSPGRTQAQPGAIRVDKELRMKGKTSARVETSGSETR